MVAPEDCLRPCLFGYPRQDQGLLVLKAHGGEAHQIVAPRQFFHILAVVLQAVYIRHMHRTQVLHMRRQRGQPQIRNSGDAVEIRLHYGGGEQ